MANEWKAERDAVIMRFYGDRRDIKSRRPSSAEWKIQSSDYIPVPMPTNNPYGGVAAGGNCLIWRYRLNAGGYGELTYKEKPFRAHRVAFEQSRGFRPTMQVNHLCNRPYCVQPGHLYQGSPKDNADDRQMFGSMMGNMTFVAAVFYESAQGPDVELAKRLRESSRKDSFNYAWDADEESRQEIMQDFICPGHKFTIPTSYDGKSKACRICGQSNSQLDRIAETGLYQLIKELCPISQVVDSIFRRIEQMPFASDEMADWRERMMLRSRQMLIFEDNHPLRTCECIRCVADRTEFRDDLLGLLDEPDRAVVQVCEQVRPMFVKALDDARRVGVSAVLRTSESSGLSEMQIAEVLDHLSECFSTSSEKERILFCMEVSVGSGWQIAMASDVFPPFIWGTPISWLMPTRLVSATVEIETILGGAAVEVTTKLCDELDQVWSDSRGDTIDLLECESLRVLRLGVKIKICELICDMLTYDVLGEVIRR